MKILKPQELWSKVSGTAQPAAPVLQPYKNSAAQTITITDRGVPTWAKYLSLFFAIAAGLAMVAVAVVSAFFYGLVASPKEAFGALPLMIVAGVPLIALIVLDYTFSRAMAGYRHQQKPLILGGRAVVGAAFSLVLAIVHPLLFLPIPVAASIAIGAMYLTNRFGGLEPAWDFAPQEATAFFAGRDDQGMSLADSPPRKNALIHSFARMGAWLAMILSLALVSWMVAQEILTLGAVIAVAILAYWAVDHICRYFEAKFLKQDIDAPLAQVRHLDMTHSQRPESPACIMVEGLSVRDHNNDRLLSDVSFDLQPGEVLGLIGPAGSGKTLLGRAMINPFSLSGLHVEGGVYVQDQSLWHRSVRAHLLPALHVPSNPMILAANGLDNLTCFHGPENETRAYKCLESMVYSTDNVDRIISTPNAKTLSASEQKALCFARAFLLSPALYLFDRPEDFASDKLLRALATRIKTEKRAGRCFIIASENRELQNLCDKFLILQNGRVTDFGPADEIRSRISAGWSRFVCERRLESEDTLQNWAQNHFKRTGDEGNQRKVCTIAAELLAFSCQGSNPMTTERISFDLKHFEGYCVMKLTDQGTLLSSGQIQMARRAVQDAQNTAQLPPLARIIQQTKSIEQAMVNDRRVITLKIATYDPRKTGPSSANPNHGQG